ncbi:MAG: DUF5808 domain-containing protein [Bacteroidota bacterium]
MNEFDKKNNENWFLGLLYHNPRDPNIWVEKRYGFGWTLNFAHDISWVIMTLLILVPIIVTFIIACFN